MSKKLFAHSALREGWDNPNVFQICTLNQTASQLRKRQEIGRGLRLCVNQSGERVTDEDLNILTVVANESYQSFCNQLQQEYREDSDDAPPPPTRKTDSEARRRDALFHSEDFRAFWQRLNRRAKYRIKIDREALIAECVAALNGAQFPAPQIARTKGRIVVTEFKIELMHVKGDTAFLRVAIKDSNRKATIKEELPVRKNDRLATALHDDRLKKLVVMEVSGDGDEAKVKFGNGEEITRYKSIEFDSEHGQMAEETRITELDYTYPVFDFIGRAAAETHLTRATLNEIFARFAERAGVTIFRNPEGFTRTFIETIKHVVARHVAERVEFEILAGEAFDAEELFPEVKKFPQKELIESGARGLYDKTQWDSEVELKFVEDRLRRDEPATVLFFKFPPKFKLDFPRVIGDYNPDWAIVRFDEQGKAKLHLVRETKGTTEIEKLQFSHEAVKIKCAHRYFAALGIDYRVVDLRVAAWWSQDDSSPDRLPLKPPF